MKRSSESWWVGVRGRRAVRGVAGLVSAGGFLLYALPNTLLIDRYQDITQLYRNGIAVAVPARVKTLVSEVLDDLRVSDAQRQFIKTYTAFGFDGFRAGSTATTAGTILGLPLNLKYSNAEEFDRTGISVNNNSVPWSSPDGESLMNSLILSDEAKKFFIARELHHIQSVEPFFFGFISAATLTATYMATASLNQRLKLYARPRGFRVVLYALMGMFGYVSWAFSKDISTCMYEFEADRDTADLGEHYARGGLEYYEKVLKRNVALRALMGADGEKLYTAYGNDKLMIRTKHTAFTERRDYLKQRVEEYGSGVTPAATPQSATPQPAAPQPAHPLDVAPLLPQPHPPAVPLAVPDDQKV